MLLLSHHLPDPADTQARTDLPLLRKPMHRLRSLLRPPCRWRDRRSTAGGARAGLARTEGVPGGGRGGGRVMILLVMLQKVMERRPCSIAANKVPHEAGL